MTNLNRLPRILVLLAWAIGAPIAMADETILFADSFDDVKGHMIGQIDGKVERGGPAATRRVLPFMGTSPLADGKLTIVAREDPSTTGFDDKPGVLAISFKSVPSAATYCGIVYLGGATPDKALALQEITDAPNVENLKRIKLSFRYKAANSLDAAAVGATFSCRLEPLVDNSYASRLGFANIQADDKWQTFETTLDRGQNMDNFLKMVVTMPPKVYKLVWGQVGPITNYQAGDTLLIDDIQFSRVSP
jgi:hypothetical protein